MTRRARRNHSATFKAKVALEAIAGDMTLAQLAEKHDLHVNQIVEWKKALQDNASAIFDGFKKQELRDVKPLVAKIGQLTMENDFLENALIKAGLLSAKR